MRQYQCWRCGAEHVVFWIDVIHWYELVGGIGIVILLYELFRSTTPLGRWLDKKT